MKTRITELFGIQYPVIQGGLQWLSTAPLATAVSNAGGLGLITARSFPDGESFRADIRRARTMTDKPFGVNLSIGHADIEQYVQVVTEERVPVVATSGRNPEPYMARFREAGCKIMHVVPAVRFAQTAERIGVDAVVVVGFECGGSPGMDDVTTLALVPRTVDSVKIPVIAGGGIGDARTFLAMLALGAEAVQIGTAWMLTEECPTHPKMKEALIQAKETDTVLINRSIRATSRVLRTPMAERILEMEARHAPLEEMLTTISGTRLRVATMEGDLESGTVACGQVIGLLNKVTTVHDYIQELVTGAVEIQQRLSSTMGS